MKLKYKIRKAKRVIKFWLNMFAFFSVIMIPALLTLHSGHAIEPEVLNYQVEQKTEEKLKIAQIEVHPTILRKIADCESGDRLPDGSAIAGTSRHYNENGTVVIGQYSKYTTDVGEYQIALEYHADKAEELGIDLFTPEGNAAYARHLYRERGTQPWEASADCWNK